MSGNASVPQKVTPVTPAEVAAAQPLEGFDTREVVVELKGLMKGVTKEKITPETVNAACQCADRITDILKLHLEVERLRRRTKGL